MQLLDKWQQHTSICWINAKTEGHNKTPKKLLSKDILQLWFMWCWKRMTNLQKQQNLWNMQFLMCKLCNVQLAWIPCRTSCSVCFAIRNLMITTELCGCRDLCLCCGTAQYKSSLWPFSHQEYISRREKIGLGKLLKIELWGLWLAGFMSQANQRAC